MPRQSELQNLVDNSDIIFWGRVGRTDSYWKSDERGRHIRTLVTLNPVFQSLKKQLEGPLSFEVIGGVIGELAESASDIPKFNSSEEVILFLADNPIRLIRAHGSKIKIFDGKVYWGMTEIPITSFIHILELMVEGKSPESIWEKQIQPYQLLLESDVPVISSISPNKASAGTDIEVTITGSNFGNTQGSGKVEFFYRNSMPKIASDIISWSSTRIVCTVPIGDVEEYPASAGSGPVTVTTSNGTSTGYMFRVTFGYGQLKWTGTNPTVYYYINENTSDCTGEEAAVQKAVNTWNTVSDNKINFVYAGSHTNTEPNLDNGINEVLWGSNDSLAITYIKYNNMSKRLIECDLVFNESYNWSTSSTPSSNRFDVESVALHEFGHWLNLRDLYGNFGDNEYDEKKVMYGLIASGTTKRALHTDDIAGIQWIYPATVQSYIDIGLRYYDGSYTVSIACEPKGTLTSSLRISKNGTTYGIVLVDPADPYASGIKIQTSSGPKALRKLQ